MIAFGLLTVLSLVAAGAYLWRLVRTPDPLPPPLPPPTTIPGPTATPSPPTPSPTSNSHAMPDRKPYPYPQVKPPGFIDPPPGQGLDRYVAQVIAWDDCRAGDVYGQCANIAAPLDYARPDDQAITLAVFRRPAQTESQGPLFVNPGGPGAPGRVAAAWVDARALPGFDLIGWDPRGTGASTPVVCGDDALLDRILSLDQSPDDLDEEVALVDGWADLGSACAMGSGELLDHIGTRDTVADLDLLRGLLGAPTLNYLGYSYGTYIGALYADTYPDRVGRLVLDSPVDITEDESVSQAAGFEQAFDRFVVWCADQTACPLGGDPRAVMDSVKAFLDELDGTPLPVGDRLLTQSMALDGVASFLYEDAAAYRDISATLEAARNGQGQALLNAADSLWQRDNNGHYSGLLPAFTAIRCLDHADGGIAAAFDDWNLLATQAPLFGWYGGLDVACVEWPVRAPAEPTITVSGIPPILIVGATGDSATPYPYAQWMAARIESAILITYTGPGHATYGTGRSRCVDEAVDRYLNFGEAPGDNITCG
jgi:pimeloyl-ACP methyl ester carboxylesterase